MSKLIANLQQRLDSRAEPATKDWWERYLKHQIPFRGVKMAAIRDAIGGWLEDHPIDAAEMRKLAYSLLAEAHAEDKLAGILLMAEWLMPEGAFHCDADLERLAQCFDDGDIDDWNTCDWMCVKVLGPLASHGGRACAEAISAWRGAPGVWRSRAAGVAFVNLLPKPEEPIPGLHRLVLETCRVNVVRTERFAQTGVGWTIRELSRSAPELAAEFVEGHLASMSREAVKSATAKLPEDSRRRLLDAHRASTRS